MKKKEPSMYRVFDNKNNYIQSYSDKLDGGFQWAKSCATRMNGRVDQICVENKEEKAETIFTASPKK
jgi:hypothetical protein